jgi:hypothetical protein
VRRKNGGKAAAAAVSPDAKGEESSNDETAEVDGLAIAKRFPKRNPKGHRFRGWRHPAEFNFFDASNANGGRAWWRNSSRCFEVDFICHRANTNTWMYMTPETKEDEQLFFQPTMELKPSAHAYDGPKYQAEIRIHIQVSSPNLLRQQTPTATNKEFFDQCQLSETPTHIVLQSLFNDMVGEFYSRSLLGLHQTMIMDVIDGHYGAATDDHDDASDNDGNQSPSIDITKSSSPPKTKPLLPWEEDIQFYIHIPLKGKKVLDGHKLLTSGMLANPPSGMPKSFLELFRQRSSNSNKNDDGDNGEEEVEFKEEEEEATNNNVDDDCLCYRKMVFCGYDVFTHDEQVNSADIDFFEEYSGTNDPTQSIVSDTTTPSFDPNLKYTLWAAGSTVTYGRDANQADCEYNIGDKNCRAYAKLRDFLLSNFIKHYPNLGQDIVAFRKDALIAKNLINDEYSGDTKEWMVVGLTQRTYRRAWLNLPTVMKLSNAKFNDRRVLFIEVNVEETSSPYEQLLLHRSLDVLIGVHGAQLTQAVLLPPHAHVLEILPWVPDYIRGNWVARRKAPTPLGIIYHNTDLNHVGYSLDRTSTDLCVGVGEVGSEEEKECFLKRRKVFLWDNRDFNVEPDVVMQYIEKLVLFMRDDDLGILCKEVKDSLDDRFVLYNIWCKEGNSILSVSHYYAEDSEEEKRKFGLGKREKLKLRKVPKHL